MEHISKSPSKIVLDGKPPTRIVLDVADVDAVRANIGSENKGAETTESKSLVFPSLDDIRQRFEANNVKLWKQFNRAVQEELHRVMTESKCPNDLVFSTSTVTQKLAALGWEINTTVLSDFIRAAIEEKGLRVDMVGPCLTGFHLRLPTPEEEAEWRRLNSTKGASVAV